METNTLEMVLFSLGFGFWILFPIGMFLSISKLDKNSDQLVQLGDYREPMNAKSYRRLKVMKERHFDWHHPLIHFRRWLHQP